MNIFQNQNIKFDKVFDYNNQLATPSNKENESIKDNNLPPNIKITNSYIEFTINNPNYGKESDLIKFYDEEYWKIVGLYPEVTIELEGIDEENTRKIGGESIKIKEGGEEEEEEGKKLTIPYKYVDYILKSNPIRSLFNKSGSTTLRTSPLPGPSRPLTILEKIGFKKKEETNIPPYNYDNDPSPIPTLLTINPTVQKDITTTVLPTNEVFQMTPENVLELDTPTKICRIKIKFTPNKGIESMKEILKSRDVNIDIDIDQEGYKKKEKEIIENIKKKKGIEIELNDIYKISGRIIIMKGVM
jgi:hypothetical protein